MALLHALVLLALITVALVVAFVDARERTRETARNEVTAVARVVADLPQVVDGLGTAEPSKVLQPVAERIRVDSGVDFVVVMALDRTRYSHPDPGQIGRPFIGDLGDAPRGGTFTQEYTGTLGPSIRAVVPVWDGGRVVAMVAVGTTLNRLDAQFCRSALVVGGAGLAALGLALGASWLIARRLRRQTYGLDAQTLTRLYEYHNAVLLSVREGLLLLDRDYRVQLVNAEGARLLKLTDGAVGRRVTDLGLPLSLVQAAMDREHDHDEVVVVGDRTLLVGTAPAVWEGRTIGAVVLLRDRTELLQVSTELEATRRLSEALRSQQHESANRLHTVIQLVEVGRVDEALDFVQEELQIAQLRSDQLIGAVGHPALSALLLGKSTEAAVFGIAVEVEGAVTAERCPIGSRDLITVAGNLLDNALDAMNRPEGGRIRVTVSWTAQAFRITVDDNGPGVPPESRPLVLNRGWSTKSGTEGTRGIGLALVQQIAQRYTGSVRVDDSPLGGASFVVELKAPQ